ncbi:MAG: MmcB family DNA repair protein [Janthinobacterium lividum]
MLTRSIVLPDDGRQSETAREVVRGTRRLLRARNIATVTELVLADGRRPDIVGLGPDGAITIVEVKSSVADLRADRKWHHYRAFCDHLYFAVPVTLPLAILPDETGIIVADGYGAEVLRDALLQKLAPATRRAMTLRFAQVAADRLHALADEGRPS